MGKGKLMAPAKAPKGGTGTMRSGSAGVGSKKHYFGDPAKDAPGPTSISVTTTQPGDCNGSEGDAGLHKEARNKSAGAAQHFRKKSTDSLLK